MFMIRGPHTIKRYVSPCTLMARSLLRGRLVGQVGLRLGKNENDAAHISHQVRRLPAQPNVRDDPNMSNFVFPVFRLGYSFHIS